MDIRCRIEANRRIHSSTHGAGRLRIACSGLLQFSLGFYATLDHTGWVIIEGPMAGGDLHVLIEEDSRPDLKLLYRDPVSRGVVMRGCSNARISHRPPNAAFPHGAIARFHAPSNPTPPPRCIYLLCFLSFS